MAAGAADRGLFSFAHRAAGESAAGAEAGRGDLAREARVSPEKCSPRSLRKLYQETQAGFRAEADRMVEEAEDRLLESEQAAIGW